MVIDIVDGVGILVLRVKMVKNIVDGVGILVLRVKLVIDIYRLGDRRLWVINVICGYML